MSGGHYAPRFGKRTTLAGLAAAVVGVFGLGLVLPYAVGDAPQSVQPSNTDTTVRRRQPVPVAQIVPSTTTTTTAAP